MFIEWTPNNVYQVLEGHGLKGARINSMSHTNKKVMPVLEIKPVFLEGIALLPLVGTLDYNWCLTLFGLG